MKISQNTYIAALAAAPLMAVALAVGVGTFTHPAAAASAGNSNKSFAVGGFTPASGAMAAGHVAFAAQVNPNDPSRYAGHVVQEDAVGVTRSGPVICAGFSGNNARIVWKVNRSDAGDVGKARRFDVTDNGEPTMGMPMDTFSDLGPCDDGSKDPMMQCSCSFPSGATDPLLRGNIVVKTP